MKVTQIRTDGYFLFLKLAGSYVWLVVAICQLVLAQQAVHHSRASYLVPALIWP
jgi:hypothetical protein